MKRGNVMEFDAWFAELKRVAVEKYGFTKEAAEGLDAKAYRETYYDDGETPEHAIVEDLSYL